MRTKRGVTGVGLRPPEKGTGIYCCVDSSQVPRRRHSIAGAKGNEMKIAKEKKMSGVNRQESQLVELVSS
jgi:hypothetical protein